MRHHTELPAIREALEAAATDSQMRAVLPSGYDSREQLIDACAEMVRDGYMTVEEITEA